MRLSFVATATLSLLLAFAPGVRAQDDDGMKPPKKKDEKKDDKKPAKKETGDEGDDEGDEKPKKPQEKLPINPFAKAKKGDWSVCLGKMKATFGEQKVNEKMKLIVRVKDVEDGEVTCTLQQSGGMGGRQEQKTSFKLKEMPTFQKYMSMNDADRGGPGGDDISDWKVEDDKKTVAGKEFACKKITAKIKDKMGTDAKLTMWVSDETKGWGMIACTIKGSMPGGGSLQMDIELKGYGNGDKADFGKKPDEDKDDEGDKGKDEDEDAPKKDKEKDKKKDKKDDE